jgi:hypothetical protein
MHNFDFLNIFIIELATVFFYNFEISCFYFLAQLLKTKPGEVIFYKDLLNIHIKVFVANILKLSIRLEL